MTRDATERKGISYTKQGGVGESATIQRGKAEAIQNKRDQIGGPATIHRGKAAAI